MRVIALVFSAVCFLSAAERGELADLTIRYVNNEVVTMGDVQLRNQIRRSDYERKGLVLPRSRDEWAAFSKRTLDDITDDVLLAQKAKSMGIQADHDEIVLEVLDAAKRSGQGLTLRDQAEQRRHLERQRTIERITGWYESLAPQPRPLDLLAVYQADTSGFNRPAQAHLLQIILRPSPPEERTRLHEARAALLRKAQEGTDPQVKAIVDARLAAFLNADAAGQDAELMKLVDELAPLAARADLANVDRQVVTEAASLAQRDAKLLDADQVRAQLEAARISLTGLRGDGQVKAFRELAKQISQGAAATRGGEIGWVEPGLYAKEFDAVAFALAAGELSAPFKIGDTMCLVLCAERKEALVRSFDEVSGEIERGLRWKRRLEARTRAVAILRTQASIRDVIPLTQLTGQ